jgi:hypothetical protein
MSIASDARALEEHERHFVADLTRAAHVGCAAKYLGITIPTLDRAVSSWGGLQRRTIQKIREHLGPGAYWLPNGGGDA